MAYYCYIVQCVDGSFYTGWTNDPQRREKTHNAGRGARYTRMHRPVTLVYVEELPDHSSVLRRERAIKKLSHEKKQKLVASLHLSGGTMPTINPSRSCYSVVSPGRVNLLGEHVDYNGGIVLPAAIDRAVRLNAHTIPDRIVRINAIDLKEQVVFSLDDLDKRIDLSGKTLPSWALYPAGVAWVLQTHGLATGGIEASFTSDIPIGSGLSSSAAVETAFAALWQTINGWQANHVELAVLCQEAENKYVGVNCGLMDQFACANGVADHALSFDTRSLEWKPVPLPANTRIVIADSGVRRTLATSAYNDRRAACEEAVRILKGPLPKIRDLRDVSVEDFNRNRDLLPEIIYKRARHVVEECRRVDQAIIYLEQGNAEGFGQLMFACHDSLRDYFEVSCPELNALVEAASRIPGCLGARLTGAGFGGCTVNLVREEAVDSFIKTLKESYSNTCQRNAEIFASRASQGVHAKSVDC